MFRKSEDFLQENIFSSNNSFLTGKSLKQYSDKISWHNQFRKEVTLRIDESIFSRLYSTSTGTPNSSIRVIFAMMILKEAEGLSDEKLFENSRYNLLTRSALGLMNIDDSLPTESTYYLFRKKVNDYAKSENINLFDLAFSAITKAQSLEFDVSGKRIRMDSKLLGSNISYLSRYELIHETLSLFYKQVKYSKKIDTKTKEQLDSILQFKGNKIVYSSTHNEIKSKIEELGILIYNILPLFSKSKDVRYQTLQRVFAEQYQVDDSQIVLPRKKETISAKSVQSPHDTDCDYRNKDGNKVKGYSINITESCDDKGLNLIGSVDLRKASTSDVDFLQDDIKKAEEIFRDKPKNLHADGAYHSSGNQEFCKDNKIDLHLHAIQGKKGRYELYLSEDNKLVVLDKTTNEHIEATSIKSKTDKNKWRIKTDKGYRYFTAKDIETSRIRKKIEVTPIEVLQKRNNVEATIFQLAYHYSNAKSRYRGIIKHQMWADVRSLWVNFVRLLKFIENTTTTVGIHLQKFAFLVKSELYFMLKNLCVPYKLLFSKNGWQTLSFAKQTQIYI